MRWADLAEEDEEEEEEAREERDAEEEEEEGEEQELEPAAEPEPPEAQPTATASAASAPHGPEPPCVCTHRTAGSAHSRQTDAARRQRMRWWMWATRSLLLPCIVMCPVLEHA